MTLEQRLSLAEGPSIDLDIEICRFLIPGLGAPSPVTASVDAGMSLVQKVFPGWMVRLAYLFRNSDRSWAEIADPNSADIIQVYHSSLALALSLVLVRAKLRKLDNETVG